MQAQASGKLAPDGTATQTFGTDGIKPMLRPSLTTRFFMRIVAWVEKLNLSCSKVGNPCVHDNAVFPWATKI